MTLYSLDKSLYRWKMETKKCGGKKREIKSELERQHGGEKWNWGNKLKEKAEKRGSYSVKGEIEGMHGKELMRRWEKKNLSDRPSGKSQEIFSLVEK